jgi:hypothetical protein
VLISAAAGGHASVAKLLLSRKAEVDAVNNVKSCFNLCTEASLLLWSCLTRFLTWLGITDIT